MCQKGGEGCLGCLGCLGCVGRRKRTISKIQRDKNQIIFPRDGFECDGGDVGVVEICRVVHYDVLIVFCVRKRKRKKTKTKKRQSGLVEWEGGGIIYLQFPCLLLECDCRDSRRSRLLLRACR